MAVCVRVCHAWQQRGQPRLCVWLNVRVNAKGPCCPMARAAFSGVLARMLCACLLAAQSARTLTDLWRNMQARGNMRGET